MTANPTTYPNLFVVETASPRRPDPVRARVSGLPQLVYSQNFEIDSASRAEATRRGLHLPPDTRGGGPHGPHGPHLGDVLYWVACLGGAGLLLLCATT